MHNTESIPWPMVIPFGAILLSIALFPLFLPHFWEKNKNKAIVSLLLSLPVLVFFIAQGNYHPLFETGHEYLSFIALLAALFIISGGISLQGDLLAKPGINTLFLGVGAILANIIGTTGASMLLIRPFLKTNSEREWTAHQPIFFIFVVSNAGGLLTPLGDPPLFLGFLRGVPFTWTLNLFPVWLLTISILLAVFFLWDRRTYRKETKRHIDMDERQQEPLRLKGGFNLLFLGLAISGVFLPTPWREILMLSMATLSYTLTPKKIHQANNFNFIPIQEVAILFAGIFVTMVPALHLLAEHGKELGLSHPAHFFWLTGVLSSFLDNAPTYLTFFSAAQAMDTLGPRIAGVPESILKAISCGAVLMGANSYIGNGPNFMVKAIADEARFKTPSFFGYMGYAALILFPIYGILTWLFF